MKKLFLLTTFVALLAQMGSAQNSSFDKNAFCKKLEKELVKINDSLYASKFECSILNYRTFLNDLKSQSKDVSTFLPDTFAGWSKKRNDVRMVPYYLSHPAYNEYPIFAITREAAVAYCKWLNEVYAGYADKKFQQMTFTLPTVSEWENAALSFKNRIQKKHYYKTINDQLITINYTWQSTNPYKENNRHSKSIDLNLLYYGSWNFLSSKKDFRKANFHDEFYQSQQTAPIKSFPPSNNGMYNVCGNVAEMTVNPDIIKGGSFLNHSFDCAIHINTNLYQIPNRDVGFRVFMKVK